MKADKHLKIKILLIILAQIVGFELASLLSVVGIQLERTTLSYFVTGSILAVITLGIYEYILMRNALKLQKELSSILNYALLRYDTRFSKNHTEKKGGK